MKPTTKRRSRSIMEAESALWSMLNRCIAFKLHHDEFVSEYAKLKERFNLTNLSWNYLFGIYSCRIKMLYHRELVWGYELDGKAYPMNWNLMPEDHKHKVRNDTLKGDHYWKNEDGTLSNRRF